MMKTATPTPVTKQAPQLPDQIQEQIRQRAYQLYEQRGREDGHDLDDWLTAESETTQEERKISPLFPVGGSRRGEWAFCE
jgi:hypothetical protein